MPTLTPSPMQQEALAYARNNGTLVNWPRGQGKTTFLAMFAQQCLLQYNDCALVLVAPTHRQALQLYDVVCEICNFPGYLPSIFMMSRLEDAHRISGLHEIRLIVLMDECLDIDTDLRHALREQLKAVDLDFRLAQAATIPQFGPAVL